MASNSATVGAMAVGCESQREAEPYHYEPSTERGGRENEIDLAEADEAPELQMKKSGSGDGIERGGSREEGWERTVKRLCLSTVKAWWRE